MTKKTFDDVMNNLKSLPQVEEHLHKIPVQLGKEILKRRIQLGLTQTELVSLIRKHGDTITQSQLSKIETGDESILIKKYEIVLKALGATDINVHFNDDSKDKDLVNS